MTFTTPLVVAMATGAAVLGAVGATLGEADASADCYDALSRDALVSCLTLLPRGGELTQAEAEAWVALVSSITDDCPAIPVELPTVTARMWRDTCVVSSTDGRFGHLVIDDQAVLALVTAQTAQLTIPQLG